MARRKMAGNPDANNPWVARCALLFGALEEIRKETRDMKGGWRSRVAQVVDLHLGGKTITEGKPCP